MIRDRNKIIVVCGPTAVGKTKISLLLAHRFSGEIVNFDSQQFYRELSIGTAKPTPYERGNIPHHLFEAVSIFEDMNAGRFVELADRVIRGIFERGKIPILVGGTGLYLRAFEYGIFKAEINPEIRVKLRSMALENLGQLYEELKRLDPEYAEKIHPHDRVRITRALEVIYSTGKPFSLFHKENPFFKREKRYRLFKIGLTLPRKELYERINARVKEMIEAGWLEEIRTLYEEYGEEVFKKIKAIGYWTLLQAYLGRLSLDEAIALIQRDTRRYAKRQLSWFRREKDINWFYPHEEEKIIDAVENFLKGD